MSMGAYTDVVMSGGGAPGDERFVTATPFQVAPTQPSLGIGAGAGAGDAPEAENAYSSVKRLGGGGTGEAASAASPFPGSGELQLAPPASSAAGAPPSFFTVRVSRSLAGFGFRVVGGADLGFPVTIASITKGIFSSIESVFLCT